MGRAKHFIYVTILLLVGIFTILLPWLYGFSYYLTSNEERFFHPLHILLKPSGTIGHGLGIFGSLMIIIGVAFYMMRKRTFIFGKLGKLKIWLEIHIFLCSVGPILVLYHTAFKFGGIVAVSFWSMVAVVLSGVAGRFIYTQIPRSIQGNELTLEELNSLNRNYSKRLKEEFNFDESLLHKLEHLGSVKIDSSINFLFALKLMWNNYFQNRKIISDIKRELIIKKIAHRSVKNIIKVCKSKLLLSRRIFLLHSFQKVFHYWHIIHLPFAIVMLAIMLIHVGITVAFGYKWIF